MKIVLFDVGNVVVKADNEITHKILQDYGVLEHNARRFYTNPEYLDFSRGKITGKDFYRALIGRYLQFQLTFQQVVYAHNEHLYDVDDGVVEFLSKIPREKLAFLTDTNEWQTEKERQLVDLSQYSDKIFRSHEIHRLKTDLDCFDYVFGELKVEPSEILLVDDSPEKISIAQRKGLQTHQFVDLENLVKEFQDRNLL